IAATNAATNPLRLLRPSIESPPKARMTRAPTYGRKSSSQPPRTAATPIQLTSIVRNCQRAAGRGDREGRVEVFRPLAQARVRAAMIRGPEGVLAPLLVVGRARRPVLRHRRGHRRMGGRPALELGVRNDARQEIVDRAAPG